jgi:SAM-dependent methyltransferase
MRYIDRVLQRWRIAKVRRFVKPGARVLDIGSVDGALFRELGNQIGGGLGIDPTLPANRSLGAFQLVTGFFPKDMPPAEPFDVITLLAVLEHFPAESYAQLRVGCRQFLKPGGLLVLTVPSPSVDIILHLLKALRLIDGMSLEEHHGFDVRETNKIFSSPDFTLTVHKKFQLGLNHLFVFRRGDG